jgi:hypothetical protein
MFDDRSARLFEEGIEVNAYMLPGVGDRAMSSTAKHDVKESMNLFIIEALQFLSFESELKF